MCGSPLPAVNVKWYGPRGIVDAIVDRFGCSESTAERAAEYAREAECERFWEDAEGIAREVLGDVSLRVYSAGRSGGWLVVRGLPNVADWDAIAVSRWGRFASAARGEIDAISLNDMLDNIDANRWAQDGAERYNFIDREGGPVCISEMKAQARAAGFGPVVRN